jgi:hypothetical protein
MHGRRKIAKESMAQPLLENPFMQQKDAPARGAIPARDVALLAPGPSDSATYDERIACARAQRFAFAEDLMSKRIAHEPHSGRQSQEVQAWRTRADPFERAT